jgi:hypothetical protein
MLRAMLWKEWREQRWKAAFGAVMVGSFSASLASARLTTRGEATLMVAVLGPLILALYSAMGVFAPERSNHTLSFLVAQPVPAWQVFACKWFCGWLNVAIPVLPSVVCFAVFGRTDSGRGLVDDPGQVFRGTPAFLALGTMAYAWVCCLTVRRRNEAAVGLAGLLIFVVLSVHMWLGGLASGAMDGPGFRGFPWAVTPNPLLWLLCLGSCPRGFPAFLAVQLLVFTGLIAYGYRCWRRSL